MNIFEKEIWNSLKLLNKYSNFYAFRLYDTRSFISRTPFVIKQPADFCAFFNGKPYLFELKSQKYEPSFRSGKILSHQMQSLLKAESSGALAYFLLNRRSIPRNYRCYAIKASIMQRLISENKESIRWDLIETNSILIPRMHQCWNLECLFPSLSLWQS